MRFALVLFAVLVVSWSCVAEVSEDYPTTGAEKSVKDIAPAFGDVIYNKRKAPVSSDGKTVTAAGAETPVKTLVATYEKLQKSQAAQNKQLPSVKEFKTALKNGKKFDAKSPLCELGAKSTVRERAAWYKQLCN